MTAPFDTPSHWPEALRETLARCTHLRRALVLLQCGSTQDVAARHAHGPGEVFIASRQTGGRGRYGRTWHDAGHTGIAVTLTLPHTPPERLSIALAVAVARAITSLDLPDAGVRWPNDVVIDHRKVAGILVEQRHDLAVVGIGINVHRPDEWPFELRDRAIALSEIAPDVARIDALRALLREIDGVIDRHDADLATAWSSFDILTGETATFRDRSGFVQGVVRRIDPMKGLEVETDEGVRWLDGSVTSRIDAPIPAE